MPSLHRIHIRPSSRSGDPHHAFRFCLEHGLLGLGWALEAPRDRTLTWDSYYKEALAYHGSDYELSRARYLHDYVIQDDLVWARDLSGV